MKMSSTKPYLIRAIYEWLIDNQLTPYLLVNANFPGVMLPSEHVKNGRIVLNISTGACRGLHLDNDRIVFTTRFSGQSTQIFMPPQAVLAIYSKENGRGMEFGEEIPSETDLTPVPPKKHKKPALTLVKKETE